MIKALHEAIHTCRVLWTQAQKEWVTDVVELSIQASIGEFQGRLFKILGQEYACNMDYSFKTCQYRHMLKIQVDYHQCAL